MRRFKFYQNSNCLYGIRDNQADVTIMDDVFEDHIDAWRGLCVVLGLDYTEGIVRTMIARGYYCTTEALS